MTPSASSTRRRAWSRRPSTASPTSRATSTRTVRLVTPTAATGVVDGGGAVVTLYGKAPRASFPEDSTFCLSGVDVPSDGVVRVVDACQGYLLELRRSP